MVNYCKGGFFIGDTNSALWYLPMTIALYLGIPIVSYALKEISNKAYITVLSIALIISRTIIPTTALIAQVFGYYPHIHSVLKMNIFGASVWGESVWMIYVIAGYIIYKSKLRNLGTWKLLFFWYLYSFTSLLFHPIKKYLWIRTGYPFV